MDEYEEYYEEVSDNEVEPQEEVVGVVAPMPVEIPLEVQVGPLADNPASPSPQTPSPAVPLPPQGSPLGDATSFMGFSPMMTWLNSNNGRWTRDSVGKD